MKIRERVQRFLWGRTHAESEAQARREAWQRFERDVDRARREGGLSCEP